MTQVPHPEGSASPSTAPPEGPAPRGPEGPRSPLLRRKPVEALLAESARSGDDGVGGVGLRRSLNLMQLTMLSVGSTLGTGIFVVLNDAVPKAGPAVALSFVVAALVALFSALSYAELAGSVPVSGSSYSYAYAALGEGAAWVCGWCLLLEYGVAVSAVAVGWGQYLNELLGDVVGIRIPDALSQPPGDGGVFNLPSAVLVMFAAFLLLRGARESAKWNNAMVALKIVTLLMFCAVAFTAIRAGNLHPFMPLGIAGVSAGASQVFFSYVGFDTASTAGEEARNPRRDLPLAIILSLGIVTVIYCLVALAAMGAVPWQTVQGDQATLTAILHKASSQPVWATLLSLGAVVSIVSVVLATLYGQTRVLYAMSRDGLMPRIFSRVNPRTSVPGANTVIVSIAVGALSAFVPLGELTDATSIGTLFAFALVNLAVIVLRRTRPGLSRGFRVPLSPLTPLLGFVLCVYAMAFLGGSTWIAFALWLVVGVVVYFAYGMRHSRLEREGADSGAAGAG
ncbi:amino acid permease [Streptomyces sp. ODS28]|uniref:amino acid permease n=1 Tax=Streptomyces sp. ODS28 TaxID=3136688 RepID=UPI0031E77434